jgi:hypothetical protein
VKVKKIGKEANMAYFKKPFASRDSRKPRGTVVGTASVHAGIRIWHQHVTLSKLDIFSASNHLSICHVCTAVAPASSNDSCSLYSDWLRAGGPWGRSSSPSSGKIFLLSTSSRPVLGPTQLPIQWVPRALSPGVKWPGREADHSAPTSAEVKTTWIYTSTPPYVFMA